MGKYSHITSLLPRKEYEDEEGNNHQDKVNEVKALIRSPPPAEEDDEPYTNDELLKTLDLMVKKLVHNLLHVAEGKMQAWKLAAGWREARYVEDEVISLMKSVKIVKHAYGQMVVDQFEAEGISSMQTESGRVLVKDEVGIRILDPMKLVEWCKRNGMENKLTLHFQTAKSLTTQLLEAGEKVPDGIEALSDPKVTK